MRLWTLHPKFLDAKGLVALWRESLLAQSVLRGNTRGYRNHPQLTRFKECADPLAAIASYLRGVHAEAATRGYSFRLELVGPPPVDSLQIEATDGQLFLEFEHLRQKLERREPRWLAQLDSIPRAHPLFHIVPGAVSPWERRPNSVPDSA